MHSRPLCANPLFSSINTCRAIDTGQFLYMPLTSREEEKEKRLFLGGDSIRTNASRYFSQRLAADSKSLHLMESRWGWWRGGVGSRLSGEFK